MKDARIQICTFGTDIEKWKAYEMTSQIAGEVAKLPAENQEKLMKVLSTLVCELEKE